jgi:hypothetical protein
MYIERLEMLDHAAVFSRISTWLGVSGIILYRLDYVTLDREFDGLVHRHKENTTVTLSLQCDCAL